jgi:AcrR family transcriptional regulator
MRSRRDTRRRIIDAAIGLHMTVGPARTTISAVARSAGVQRLTVYRHFPREDDLFAACTLHGWERNPLPDFDRWREIRDPEQRLRVGLGELYAYYDRVGDAFLVILRDLPSVPALAEANAPYFAQWGQMRDILARGWNVRGRRRQRLLAAIEHALDLTTWESLRRRRVLPADDAVELLVGLVCAC